MGSGALVGATGTRSWPTGWFLLSLHNFFLSEQMSFYRNFRFFPSGVPGRAKPVFLRTHLSQTTAVDISTGKFPVLNKGAGAKQNYREDKI